MRSNHCQGFVGVVLFLASAVVLLPAHGSAQTGDGALVGNVTDAQGAVLPGVTVTATGPSLIGERVALSDGTGYYRLRSLPPGEYSVKAELPGFAIYQRGGIVVRAGATFTVNVTLQLSSLSENVTVTADSPMVETAAPITSVTVSGEFQREIPLSSRRNWSDVLELTPGIYSRPFDDNSGRQVYHGRGSGHWTHTISVDGANAVSYYDAQPTFINMSTDSIGDVEMKTGGVDAASPMGTGISVNIVTPSGGNAFHGQATSTLQPMSWNGDNTKNARAGGGGTPTIQQVYQWDGSIGGPIKRDLMWFFGSIRVNRLTNAISRTPADLERLQAFRPGFEPFNNQTKATQWFVKATTQLSLIHNLLVSASDDRVTINDNREHHTHPTRFSSTGGGLFTGRLDSIWTSKFSSQMLFSYNNKSGSDVDTFDELEGFGPEVTVHQDAFPSGGILQGTGTLAIMNNQQSLMFEPASLITVRADFTYYTPGRGGSHEFKWGFYGAPRNNYDQTRQYLNDGFISEHVRLRNPADLQSGFIPFRREYVTPIHNHELSARERDLAVYVQDSLKLGTRLTVNAGVRVDFVKRFDKIFNITRQKSTEVGPRLGVSYLLDRDARNVLRGSITRTHQPLTGRDNITRFLGGGSVDRLVVYDMNGDGVFETENFTPATTQSLVTSQLDPKTSQPYTDEFILGYRRQFAGQLSIDVAGIHKKVKNLNALVEINGFWPEGPVQPFGGFGRVDPNRGLIYQQTENTWSQLNLSAIDVIVTKNMRNGLTLFTSFTRQWHDISGDWNPTDPARFIQPDAFPMKNVTLHDTRGNNEHNHLDGDNRGSSIWMRGSFSAGWNWRAPWSLTVSGSFTARRTHWAGPIYDREGAPDPRFGPARITLANGTTQPNPLATAIRFAYPTRGEGQVPNPMMMPLGLKIAREFVFANGQKLELGSNILNVFNQAEFYQFGSGANQRFSPNYLTYRSQQPARAFQMLIKYKF
jgi:Carboxypeptidase regulatory-like domain/TonB dependent receptor